MSPEKEVVNPWALYEIESKQEWAKEARSNKLSEQGVDGKPMNPKSKGYGNWAEKTQKT